MTIKLIIAIVIIYSDRINYESFKFYFRVSEHVIYEY